jgi:beta-glucosidase
MPVTPVSDLGDGATRGMTVEYFADPDMSGPPVAVETRDTNSLTWFAGMHELGIWDRPAAVRASGRFVPKAGGRHLFYVGGTGSVRLLVGGRLVLEDDRSVAPGDVMGMLKAGDAREVAVDLAAGEPVELVVEFRYGAARAQGLWYGIREPDDAETMLQRAVTAAAAADTVILIVGETSDAGVESKDRESTELDPLQVRLIREVTAANRRTIVVANVGHAFDTSWDDGAAALLLTWYAGEEFGQALAEVLSGVREPGGRMPVTIAQRDGDYPAFNLTPDADGDLAYAEGTAIGYRGLAARGIAPRHALGAGSGYAQFELSELDALPLPSGAVEVSLTIANLSPRAGKEVVQLYRSEPELTLIGFSAVHLAAGETRRLSLVLEPRRFMVWEQGWRWLGPVATLRAGRSSVELPLERTVALPAGR